MFPVTVCTDTDFQGDSFKQHFLSLLFEIYSTEHKGPQRNPTPLKAQGYRIKGRELINDEAKIRLFFFFWRKNSETVKQREYR